MQAEVNGWIRQPGVLQRFGGSYPPTTHTHTHTHTHTRRKRIAINTRFWAPVLRGWCMNYEIVILKWLNVNDATKGTNPYVTLEHKTSLKCQFFEIEISTQCESWINKLYIDVWFVMIGQYLKIWNLRVQKNLNIDNIIFKVVQINSYQCILLINN